MNRNVLMCILTSVLSLTSLHSNAALIEGILHGTVIYADNHNQYPAPYPVNAFWSYNILGQSVFVNFMFDTDRAPENSGYEGDVWQGSNNRFIDLNFFVDGKALEVSKIPNGFTIERSSERFAINEPEVSSGLRIGSEYFSLTDYNYSKKDNYLQTYLGVISIIDKDLPIYDRYGNIRSFYWVDNGEAFDSLENIPALASFSTYSIMDGTLDYANIRVRINDFKLIVHDGIQLSEPSGLGMLMLAFGGLLLRRLKV